MELIVPNPLNLAYTYSTSVSAYAAWASGSDYSKGQRVHDPLSAGGDGHDYEAQAYLSNSTTRPSASSNKDWADVGLSGSDALSYESDADLSEYSTWTSGQAVSKGKIQVDLADQNDYIATVAITTGDNTTRPSVAVLSDDTDLAARWVRIGTANAFRLFDGRALSRTRADSSLSYIALATGLCDRVGFAGLRNIKSVSVTVNAGEKFPNPSFVSALLAGWEGTISYSSGQISSGDAKYLMPFVVGKTYAVTATFESNSGTANLFAKTPDLVTIVDSDTSTDASGTLSLSFTATARQHYIQFTASIGTITVTAVSAKQASYTQEIKTADLEYTAGGEYKRVCKLTHTAVDSPEYDVVLASEYDKEEIQVGLMVAGVAEDLGITHADVNDATDDYSRIVFDEDYGTAELLERGYSRRLSLTLQVEATNGAFAHHRLRSVRATPCFWDFNDSGGTDDGLIVHGLAQRPERVVTGIYGLDTIRLELKGLVE
jgi:hypothetical protein